MGFWRSAFSESDGTGSFSRVATAFLIASVLTWVTFLVWKNHSFGGIDWLGLAGFVMALYGSNKFATFFGKYGTNTKPPNGGPTP